MRAHDAATIDAALHCNNRRDVETIYLINLQINNRPTSSNEL